MKTFISIAVVLLSLLSFSNLAFANYCKGYQDGFKVSCKAAKGYYCLVPPCPPVPPPKSGEPTSSYDRGVLHGTLDGVKS